ncbi:cache domain-containing protein [Oxalobacteraceae bacterium]|nr:cache domain-containing protein [Oxalobacteraceae bacterium]
MTQLIKNAFLCLFFFALSGSALADQQSTAEEVSTLVKKAVVYLNKSGRDKMLVAASDPKGGFVERDIYLSVYDLNGKVLAHGSNPKLIGVNVTDLRDVNNKYFIKEILSIAGTANRGWVDYKWVDPATGTLRDKTVYLEKAGDLIIAAGYYKK